MPWRKKLLACLMLGHYNIFTERVTVCDTREKCIYIYFHTVVVAVRMTIRYNSARICKNVCVYELMDREKRNCGIVRQWNVISKRYLIAMYNVMDTLHIPYWTAHASNTFELREYWWFDIAAMGIFCTNLSQINDRSW